jgi:hypothetical protein
MLWCDLWKQCIGEVFHLLLLLPIAKFLFIIICNIFGFCFMLLISISGDASKFHCSNFAFIIISKTSTIVHIMIEDLNLAQQVT